MTSPSPSIFSISSSDFEPSGSASPPAKQRKLNPKVKANKPKADSRRVAGIALTKRILHTDQAAVDIEDTLVASNVVHRPHCRSYHDVQNVVEMQQDLLSWFEAQREKRGMPWRKRYDPGLSEVEKGQRAYEIWVSEVMLQQTQVATVIAYWKRWIEKWPTIADLAKADIEEVNAAWRGLGYYRRARSLLKGAQTVMGNEKYHGRLPSEPAVLEKEIDGVGRYTAGAICSMAYGVRTPIVDGNIHRLFTRLLALHSPQTAPGTVKFLWSAADELVDHLPKVPDHKGLAGDWNQALMELGSQVCKPVSPDCAACPLSRGCKAKAEISHPPPKPESASCDLCSAISLDAPSDTIASVTVFPMRKEKKTSREEEEVVCVVEWEKDGQRKWLFTKRPEKGLLAGLFQPPTTPVSLGSSGPSRKDASLNSVSSLLSMSPTELSIKTYREVGHIQHIFSHINMTYHIQHLVLNGDLTLHEAGEAVWLDAKGVEHANVGTGVKKVWAEVYGAWGEFDSEVCGRGSAKKSGSGVGKKRISAAAQLSSDGKIVKKVMMPSMPKRQEIDM